MKKTNTYIAILRGINVSGHKLINMKLLKEMFENHGFKNVRTYIQSGNIVFESASGEPEQLAGSIAQAINTRFGFDVPVLVLTAEELLKMSDSNNFIKNRNEDISKLHVTFLSAKPEALNLESLKTVNYPPDEFYIDGKSIYLFCPGGYGNTKLTNTFFEKKLKVTATTRNWNTVMELMRMSRAV